MNRENLKTNTKPALRDGAKHRELHLPKVTAISTGPIPSQRCARRRGDGRPDAEHPASCKRRRAQEKMSGQDAICMWTRMSACHGATRGSEHSGEDARHEGLFCELFAYLPLHLDWSMLQLGSTPENLRCLIQVYRYVVVNKGFSDQRDLVRQEGDGVKGKKKRRPWNSQQPINSWHLQASLKVPASSATSFARYAPSIAHRLVHIAVNIRFRQRSYSCPPS